MLKSPRSSWVQLLVLFSSQTVLNVCSTSHLNRFFLFQLLTLRFSSFLLTFFYDELFILWYEQIRIHSTRRCDFYLYVQSRPTIEDCDQLRFAPYAFTYPKREEHFQVQHLNLLLGISTTSWVLFTEIFHFELKECKFENDIQSSKNKWSEVQDFNCPTKLNSPHWSIIPEKERIFFVYEEQKKWNQTFMKQRH